MKNDIIVLDDAQKDLKYYAVSCKCGHVKPNRYVEITFAIIAENGREAAKIATKIGRVKHNKKDRIIFCKEVSKEEYCSIREHNRIDPYLNCKNIQEQRLIEGFESRIVDEPEPVTYKKSKKERKGLIEYKLKRQKLILKELILDMRRNLI